MNGAVQGAATTTARAPVRNAPATPSPLAPEPTPCTEAPTSNTPDMFRATSSISRARTATTGGDCSWKPQPTAAPPGRRGSLGEIVAGGQGQGQAARPALDPLLGRMLDGLAGIGVEIGPGQVGADQRRAGDGQLEHGALPAEHRLQPGRLGGLG